MILTRRWLYIKGAFSGHCEISWIPVDSSLCRVFASEILTLIYDTNIQMCGEITDSTDKRSPAVRSRDQYWWHNVRGWWFKFIQSTSMPPLPLHLMFGIKYKGCRVVFFAEFLFKPRNLIFHVHTVQRRLLGRTGDLNSVINTRGITS